MLGSRALDLLAALLEVPGEIQSKDVLLAKVWPNTHVEETSLRVHIAAIRRVLDDGEGSFVSTVPGRGYAFVGTVDGSNQNTQLQPVGTAAPVAQRKRSKLPSSVARVVGRDDVVSDVLDNLDHRRCVTITGPGGIGKTTVALAAAEKLQDAFGEGAVFIDLSPVQDPAFVTERLATALGIEIAPDRALIDLCDALIGRDLLIILDNCEHVVAAAAMLVEGLLRYTDQVRILATSREPLRIEGEWVQRIPSLGLPRSGPGISSEEALLSPAVQLFVERAAESLGGFNLSYGDAGHVVEICRGLDGNALAIEFAASRLRAIGLAQLASQLDDRFGLLQSGKRTAMPRQQTLRATLDWSYDLLTVEEQRLLAQLSHFQSSFTLDAAMGLCAEGSSPDQVTSCVFELVDKSLISASRDQPELRYRLLDTTRAYGREKLDEMGWTERTARAHAQHLLATLERLSPGREPFAFLEGKSSETPEIEELRSALRWAFSDTGDSAIGAALTISALPLWWQLSLVDESLDWVERSLASVADGDGADPRMAMTLHAALGGLQMYASGRVRNAAEEWQKAYSIASSLNDVEYQLRALRALWSKSLNEGEFSRCLQYGLDFRATAERAGMVREVALAGRFIGAAQHFIGRHDDAEAATQEMLTGYIGSSREEIVRFQFDQRISARLVTGRIPALRGMFETAMTTIEQDVEEALALGHTLTTCCLLSQSACPTALLAEDYTALARYVEVLKGLSDTRALDIWNRYAVCFDAMAKIDHGKSAEGLEGLSEAFDSLEMSGFNQFRTSFLLAQHNALTALGRNTDAIAVLDRALALCRTTGEGWLLPELIRARAQHKEEGSPEVALENYRTALTLASSQKALAWELRIASNLARLEVGSGRPCGGKEALQKVLERSRQGHHRRHFKEATSLLAILQ